MRWSVCSPPCPRQPPFLRPQETRLPVPVVTPAPERCGCAHRRPRTPAGLGDSSPRHRDRSAGRGHAVRRGAPGTHQRRAMAGADRHRPALRQRRTAADPLARRRRTGDGAGAGHRSAGLPGGRRPDHRAPLPLDRGGGLYRSARLRQVPGRCAGRGGGKRGPRRGTAGVLVRGANAGAVIRRASGSMSSLPRTATNSPWYGAKNGTPR